MRQADATTSPACWCGSDRRKPWRLRTRVQPDRSKVAHPARRPLIVRVHQLEWAILRDRLSGFAVGDNYRSIVEGGVDLSEGVDDSILVRSLGYHVHRKRFAVQFLSQTCIEARQQQR